MGADEYSTKALSYCYSTASVSGEGSLGGLAGYAGLTVSECFATGNVTGNAVDWDCNAGGLFGMIEFNQLINCYSTGNVNYKTLDSDYMSTDSAAGGLVGFNKGYIKDCYTTSKVTTSRLNNTGALVGFNRVNASVSNCFWDSDKTGQTVDIGRSNGTKDRITGLNSTEMSDVSHFINAGWSSSAWDFTSGPPTIKDKNPKPSEGLGTLRLQVGTDSSDSSCIHVDLAFDLGSFSLDFSSADSCVSAIDEIDGLLNVIGKKMSDFGAVLNRLDSVLSSQVSTIENLTGSKSTILDADIAKESAEFVKNQILQQTTSALLVQAQSAHSSVIRALIQ